MRRFPSPSQSIYFDGKLLDKNRMRMRSLLSLVLCWLAKNVYACAATKITWSISGKVIGLEAESPRNVVKMKEEMAAFFVSGSDVVLLLLSEIESYLGRNV